MHNTTITLNSITTIIKFTSISAPIYTNYLSGLRLCLTGKRERENIFTVMSVNLLTLSKIGTATPVYDTNCNRKQGNIFCVKSLSGGSSMIENMFCSSIIPDIHNDAHVGTDLSRPSYPIADSRTDVINRSLLVLCSGVIYHAVRRLDEKQTA